MGLGHLEGWVGRGEGILQGVALMGGWGLFGQVIKEQGHHGSGVSERGGTPGWWVAGMESSGVTLASEWGYLG